MIAETIDQDTTAIEWTQHILLLAGLFKKHRKPVLHHLLSASYLVRLNRMFKSEETQRAHIEEVRQEAEATFDLHDSVERWMRGDHPIWGFPSEKWKALHPQMNYHLQRIRHREQHELWGASRLPACKAKEQATIAFLNSGGDAEETRGWPEGLEEEFLNSLIWQWKNDTVLSYEYELSGIATMMLSLCTRTRYPQHHYRSAIHQLRAQPSRFDQMSPAQNLQYARQRERETGMRNTALPDEPGPPRRRPPLLERLRAATSRRSSNVPTETDQSRNRGSSLVTKAKILWTNHRRPTTPAPTTPEQTFRRLPDQLSRQEEAASETEKLRLSIEASTPITDLIVRWKNTNDWLTPSAHWKRTHPAMNFHLWNIIHGNPKNPWRVQAAAERNLIDAKLLYEKKGGDGEEWWPSDLEEELLDAWAVAYEGQDPPFCNWKLSDGQIIRYVATVSP